jgi:hypothetical protein
MELRSDEMSDISQSNAKCKLLVFHVFRIVFVGAITIGLPLFLGGENYRIGYMNAMRYYLI